MSLKLESEPKIMIESAVYYSNATEILPGIWLGNTEASHDGSFLKDKLIKSILNCTSTEPFADHPTVKNKIRFAIDENTIMDDYFYQTTKQIQKLASQGCLLIHCYNDKQISGAVLAAYLIKYGQMDYGDAVKAIKSKKPDVFENECYLQSFLEIFNKTPVIVPKLSQIPPLPITPSMPIAPLLTKPQLPITPLLTDLQLPIVNPSYLLNKSLQNSFQLPTNGFQLPTNGFQLPTNGFQLPTNGFQLPVNNFQFPMNNFQMPINNFQVPINLGQFASNSVQLGQNYSQLPQNPPNQLISWQNMTASGAQSIVDYPRLDSEDSEIGDPTDEISDFDPDIDFDLDVDLDIDADIDVAKPQPRVHEFFNWNAQTNNYRYPPQLP